MAIRLLNKTLRMYLLFAIPVIIIGTGGFYFFLRYIIIHQIDQTLDEDKADIIDFFNSNRTDFTEFYKNISCSYYLKEIPLDSGIVETYAFVSYFDSIDNEFERFRELRTNLQVRNKNYELVLNESLVKSSSLIYSLITLAAVLFGLLTLGISTLQWYASKRIWQPFYKTLRFTGTFHPGKKHEPLAEDSPIKEFNYLNEAFNKMTDRLKKDFERQKKFIDNVAHELQTPLAVASSDLELLIQDIDFDKKKADTISHIDETISRMKKLNSTLLLLSRIDNDQFTDKKDVEVTGVINHYLESHQDQILSYDLTITKNIKEKVLVFANPMLIEILIGNLVKNAIEHNVNKGFIRFILQNRILTIENSGKPINRDPNDFFNKYVFQSQSKSSSGVGLSIVKEICNYCGYNVSYNVLDETTHQLVVEFLRKKAF